MFEYILFDFDGTLFDTLEGITKSVRYAVNKQGIDAQLSELRCFAGPPLTDMFMEKFGFTEELAEKATEDFRERYCPIGVYESSVFAGIKEMLAALRAAGKRLAIATSKPLTLARELLLKNGMEEMFDVLCGSADAGNNSAKWQVVMHAMEELAAERDSTVLVGDTKYDVEGAHKCGIGCIGVRYGYSAEGELEKAGADWIVDGVQQLEKLLLK